MPATSLNAARPRAFARTASLRRWSSVSRTAALPQLLPKHAILFDKVVDPRPLSALNPAGERPDDELQQESVHASHRNAGAVRRDARACANTLPTLGTVRERNHQGVGNRLLVAAPMNNQGPVKRRERLGGNLNFYYRRAA
jgi:hypothetical protein